MKVRTRILFGSALICVGLVLFSTLILSRDTGKFVDEPVLQLVAQSEPDKQLLRDGIDFFETRLRERQGDDLVARTKLIEAYSLRFKAYGNKADLKLAKDHLHALRAQYPEKPSLKSSLAGIYMAEHRFDEALAMARQAVQGAGPDNENDLNFRLFDVLLATGNYEEAERLLHTKNFNRRSFDFLVREARLADKLGNLPMAKENMQKALAEAKAFAQSPVVIAWCLTTLGHFEHHSGNMSAAVENYLAAVQHLPGYPAAIEGLAAISHTVDRNGPAAKVLYRTALRHGGELDILLRLSEIEEQFGNSETADQYRSQFINAATENKANERLYWRPLASVLAEKAATRKQALQYARLDLNNRPNSESWNTFAWVSYLSGDLDAAVQAARKAVAFGVPEPVVAYHAGVIFYEAGELEAAERFLREASAASAELDAETMRDIAQRLESIRS